MDHTSFKSAIEFEVRRRFHLAVDPETTKRQIHLEIVADVAELLQIPISSHEKQDDIIDDNKQLTISPDVQQWMDNAWKDIQIAWKLTTKEIKIRECIQGQHTVSVSLLLKYFDILIKRNIISGKCNDRKNECILKNRDINKILAIDGFSGFLPRDYKNYIENLQHPPTHHIIAVREMYNYFDKTATTGTDAVCLIFLALLNIYLKCAENILDKNTKHVIDRVKQYVEMFLQKQAQYYTDIYQLLKENDIIEKIYMDQQDLGKLENLAVNQMMQLVKRAPKLFFFANK